MAGHKCNRFSFGDAHGGGFVLARHGGMVFAHPLYCGFGRV